MSTRRKSQGPSAEADAGAAASSSAGAAAASSRKGGRKDDRSGAQYHCDYCRKDISNTVRIRCAECADFDLCLECFSVGVEVFPHKNNHKYRVIDHITTPIFEEDWGADEELLLLEAIEMYGLGNWSDVSDHVGTKSRQDCEQHYYDVYLNSKTAPLPDLEQPLMSKSQAKKAQDEAEKARQQRSGSAAKPKKMGTLGSLIGYIPHRGDFDIEYENDAETVLADMEFKAEDTPQERELKLRVLQIYNEKLDTRMERKQFILDRDLLDPPDRKLAPEERSIEESMRVFARYHSKQEHEAFIQGLVNEARLRRKIEQLQNYRLNGIRTLEDGKQFDEEQAKQRGESNNAFDFSRGRAVKRSGSETQPRTLKKRKGSRADGAGVGKSDFDITNMDGYELLSDTERKLCTDIRLIPRHYITVKDTILQQSFSRGFLERGKARKLVTIDIKRTDRIFDFFVSVGWVKEKVANKQTATAKKNSKAKAAPSGGDSTQGLGAGAGATSHFGQAQQTMGSAQGGFAVSGAQQQRRTG